MPSGGILILSLLLLVQVVTPGRGGGVGRGCDALSYCGHRRDRHGPGVAGGGGADARPPSRHYSVLRMRISRICINSVYFQPQNMIASHSGLAATRPKSTHFPSNSTHGYNH